MDMKKLELVVVSGNTYPVKDQIRALGGRWDAARKVWMVPSANAAQAQALVPLPQERTSYVPKRGRSNEERNAYRSQHDTGSGFCTDCGSYCYGDCGAS